MPCTLVLMTVEQYEVTERSNNVQGMHGNFDSGPAKHYYIWKNTHTDKTLQTQKVNFVLVRLHSFTVQ